MNRTINNALNDQAGLTYVETLLAVVLLAVCLVPMQQTFTNVLAHQTSMADMRKNSSCIREALEKTMTDSYDNLLSNARSTQSMGVFSTPILSYSLAPSTTCRYQRNVFILRYDSDPSVLFSSTSDNMLYIRVEQAETAPMGTLAISP